MSWGGYIPGSLLRAQRPLDERQLRLDRAAAERLERFGAENGGLTESEQRELDGLRRRIAWLERQIAGGSHG